MTAEDDITPEEIIRIDARWKSDMDRRVDYLIRAEAENREKYGAFLDLLIKREEARQRRWDAVIEKSWSALILAALAGLGAILLEWLQGKR